MKNLLNLVKNHRKLFIKLSAFVIIFFAMAVFLFNNDFLYKKTIIKITAVSTTQSENKTNTTGITEKTFTQNITARITNNQFKGKTVSFSNSYSESEISSVKYNKGDKLFASITETENGLSVKNLSQKRDSNLFLLIAFVALLLIFISGRSGILTLLSLIFNVATFLFCLKYCNENEFYYSLWAAEIIVFTVITLIMVSGFRKKTFGAVISTLVSVALVSLLFYFTIYLNADLPYDMQKFETASLPLKDIFFISSILGLLGAVMDNAVTINTSVSEIVATNKNVTYASLVQSIYEISYDIMGTMINVLFFAYLSSSLPIIILKLSNGYNLISVFTIDYIFDIVRFLVGSIGIVISLPVAGIISIFIFKREVSK